MEGRISPSPEKNAEEEHWVNAYDQEEVEERERKNDLRLRHTVQSGGLSVDIYMTHDHFLQ